MFGTKSNKTALGFCIFDMQKPNSQKNIRPKRAYIYFNLYIRSPLVLLDQKQQGLVQV